MSQQNSEDNNLHSDPWQGHHSPPLPPNPWELERRIGAVEQSTQTIKDELQKINSNLSKLVWIVITAVLLAGLNVIFSGNGVTGIGGL